MTKITLFLLSLILLAPRVAETQTQDIQALRIVTQAFEKAKKDETVRREALVTNKTHLIENLNADGKFESVEKEAVFRTYTRNNKLVEELVSINPPNVDTPRNPVAFDKLLDAFLSRFYFLLSHEIEEIDGQRCYKIHFWPKENLPPESDQSDQVINRIAGIIYINEKTSMVLRINASLAQEISKSGFWTSYHADKLDLEISFQEWHKLGLLKKITATARYSYRIAIVTVQRYQTHTLYLGYETK